MAASPFHRATHPQIEPPHLNLSVVTHSSLCLCLSRLHQCWNCAACNGFHVNPHWYSFSRQFRTAWFYKYNEIGDTNRRISPISTSQATPSPTNSRQAMPREAKSNHVNRTGANKALTLQKQHAQTLVIQSAYLHVCMGAWVPHLTMRRRRVVSVSLMPCRNSYEIGFDETKL